MLPLGSTWRAKASQRLPCSAAQPCRQPSRCYVRCLLSRMRCHSVASVLPGQVVDTVRLLHAPLSQLMAEAALMRDQGHAHITFSPKVFIPLTRLCRDSCGYCTFAQPPKPGHRAYMTLNEVLAVCKLGAEQGCKEALFTLGDKPELKHPEAAAEIAAMGYSSTLDYVAAAAGAVMQETGLLPHINAGVMSQQDVIRLKAVSASQGLMLEGTSPALASPGGPHYQCPDKEPDVRLATIEAAGQARVPFTSGILIGIGESREDRLIALTQLYQLHMQYGHIQEIIIQNFRSKPHTAMQHHPEPSLDDLLWTVAAARIIFGPHMNIQAPPNLTPSSSNDIDDSWRALLAAGINDWGGISPITNDYVNPEKKWPHLQPLAAATAAAGKLLLPRLPVYPQYILDLGYAGSSSSNDHWLSRVGGAASVAAAVVRASDSSGLVRGSSWVAGMDADKASSSSRTNSSSSSSNGLSAIDWDNKVTSVSQSHRFLEDGLQAQYQRLLQGVHDQQTWVDQLRQQQQQLIEAHAGLDQPLQQQQLHDQQTWLNQMQQMHSEQHDLINQLWQHSSLCEAITSGNHHPQQQQLSDAWGLLAQVQQEYSHLQKSLDQLQQHQQELVHSQVVLHQQQQQQHTDAQVTTGDHQQQPQWQSMFAWATSLVQWARQQLQQQHTAPSIPLPRPRAHKLWAIAMDEWGVLQGLPQPTIANRQIQQLLDSVLQSVPAVAGGSKDSNSNNNNNNNNNSSSSSSGREWQQQEVELLLSARGADMRAVVAAADLLRQRVCGDDVSYVVNRNINYTNVCTYSCKFCAFSKGKSSESLRGTPYLLPLTEISRRSAEAWQRGATEVCLQGGIHPDFTGETYLQILAAAKAGAPDIHVHAFSPLEVLHGATTLGLSLHDFLSQLKEAGLGSLPGTAAEVLDPQVRAVLCPDKLSTEQWLQVVSAAHDVGLPTTSTIMFGHVDSPAAWARHLLHLRELQAHTGGITEFVPLPFVHMESPIYLAGGARKGPTLRECILMHAVARLVLHPHITNMQASWVKMGPQYAAQLLAAGCNDMGGSIMNESITKAAGASYGQELPPTEMEHLIRAAGRRPYQRTTLYGKPPEQQVERSFCAAELAPVYMGGGWKQTKALVP